MGLTHKSILYELLVLVYLDVYNHILFQIATCIKLLGRIVFPMPIYWDGPN